MHGDAARVVMVVDDDDDIREGLTDLLRSQGYEVRAAIDGRDALAQLRRDERAVDIIVLDLMMPRMDGVAFRWEQLADPRLAAIPIVVVSASADNRTTANKLGAVACISKPFELEDLLSTLSEVCGAASL